MTDTLTRSMLISWYLRTAGVPAGVALTARRTTCAACGEPYDAMVLNGKALYGTCPCRTLQKEAELFLEEFLSSSGEDGE